MQAYLTAEFEDVNKLNWATKKIFLRLLNELLLNPIVKSEKIIIKILCAPISCNRDNIDQLTIFIIMRKEMC